MKILFTLTQAFNPNDGGVQRTTYKLGKYFTEQEHDVGYYSYDKAGKHVPAEFGELFIAPEEGGITNATNISDMVKSLQTWKPDIVINQMPYEKELRETLGQNKTKYNYKLLGCLRNSLFNFKSNVRDKMQQLLPWPAFKLIDNPIGLGFVQWRHKVTHSKDLKAIIDEHDYFILLTPPNKQELAFFVGDYKPEKIMTIPNSIPEVFTGQMNKEKIILFVGRLNVTQKRADLLPEFWEKTYQRLPDWHFVIVGDGPYRAALEEELKKRKLPRVRIEGYQKPEPYFKRASIFIMTSAYEGFPNTILEAQSFGCASVAFNSYDALPWIVNDGVDALLSKPFDIGQMADQTVWLGSNSANMANIQEMAKQNAARFTIDRVGPQWLEFFKEIKE